MPDVRPDIREVYEMVTKQKPADPGGLERQHTRQVRTMRNRKIGAFAVAGAIGVAVLALIFGPGGERAPAPPEPGAQTRATTAEKVARTFVGSLGTFETKEAIDRLADDADISAVVTSLGDEGLQGTPDELPLFASMLDAMDYEQHLVSCDETATSGPATDVRCTFDFHLLGSREFGRSPFSGSSFDLTVQGGEIVEASLHWEVATFSAEMWEPFAEWVSTNHPGDAAVMYEDATYGAVHLTEGSVQLWDRRVREYVRENASIRPATPLRLSAAAGDVRFSFEIPSPGWGRFGNISINKSIVGPQGAEAIIFWTTVPDGIAEPCTALSGPSGAVAATIATAPGMELDAGPSNVVLGGYPAKYVTVTVREDAGCDPGYFFTWPDVRWGALWPATGVGDTIRVWIVDVGSTRLFIEAETNDQADPDLEREVQQIVGSIRFE
jgi:hypothetical protein